MVSLLITGSRQDLDPLLPPPPTSSFGEIHGGSVVLLSRVKYLLLFFLPLSLKSPLFLLPFLFSPPCYTLPDSSAEWIPFFYPRREAHSLSFFPPPPWHLTPFSFFFPRSRLSFPSLEGNGDRVSAGASGDEMAFPFPFFLLRHCTGRILLLPYPLLAR